MRIFLTHILPVDKIAESGLSFAACNFSFNLMTGRGFDKVLSTMPLFVNLDLSDVNDAEFELVYSPLHHLKSPFFRVISVLHDQWIIFKKIQSKNVSLWLYNLCQMNFLLVLLLWMFKPQVRVNVIALDYTPKTRFSMASLFLWMMNRSDGMICLADNPYYKCKNKICLPGVIPLNENTPPKIDKINYVFLLSGVINEEISSISKVLKVFSQMPKCILHITGNVEDEDLLEKYTSKYSNIIYEGKLTSDNYYKLLHRSCFVLSTRNPNSPENQFNFPSKVMEALWHNRIVISTICYPQLKDFQYFVFDYDNLTNGLKSIMSMDNQQIMCYANQAEDIKSKFAANKWNKAFVEVENHE